MCNLAVTLCCDVALTCPRLFHFTVCVSPWRAVGVCLGGDKPGTTNDCVGKQEEERTGWTWEPWLLLEEFKSDKPRISIWLPLDLRAAAAVSPPASPHLDPRNATIKTNPHHAYRTMISFMVLLLLLVPHLFLSATRKYQTSTDRLLNLGPVGADRRRWEVLQTSRSCLKKNISLQLLLSPHL